MKHRCNIRNQARNNLIKLGAGRLDHSLHLLIIMFIDEVEGVNLAINPQRRVDKQYLTTLLTIKTMIQSLVNSP